MSFLATWLKNKRVKHHVEHQRLGRGSHGPGQRVTITMAATKAELKGAGGQRVVVIADDTTRAVDHLGKSCADALVADLPYGVQHGSRVGAELSRRPAELMHDALPVWRSLLRPGSAMALSWNTRTLSRPGSSSGRWTGPASRSSTAGTTPASPIKSTGPSPAT